MKESCYVYMLNREKRNMLIANTVLLLMAFCWGVGTPVTADVVRNLTPIWGSALRMDIAALAIIFIFHRRIRLAERIEWKYGSILGLLVSTIYIMAAFALVYSTASKQSFIIGGSVLMVPFLAWAVSGRRPHSLIFAGAALSTAGLMIMGFSSGMRFNFGDLISFVMCALFAVQVITIEHMVKDADATTLAAIHIVFIGVITTAAAFVFEGVPDFASISLFIWCELIFLGLVNTVICFFIQIHAQKYTSASHTAIILSMESLFGYLVAVLSGQDPFFIQGAIGGALVIAGVLLSEMEIFVKKNRVQPTAHTGG